MGQRAENSFVFALIVMTMGTLAVAYAAVVLIDCSMASFELIWADPMELCSAVDSVGLGADPLVGFGLAIFSLLAVFAIWVPVLKRHRRKRRIEPDRSLAENLARISQMAGETTSHEPAESEPSRDSPEMPSLDAVERSTDWHHELLEALSALEADLDSPAGPSREATAKWMRLLREVNRRHNDGSLPTEEFKTINTRLLEVATGPSTVSI